MLRLREPQESIWDALLPSQARTLNDELATVDAWLSDERFFGRIDSASPHASAVPLFLWRGDLRLMYLKHRYGFGYETLVREVTDSLHWRRFCHIPLDGDVPHPTTLSKLTRRYGPAVLQDLNTLLLRKARDRKVLRTRKLRMDTTVIQAPIEHPTDIGLLADAVQAMTRTVKRIQAVGAAAGTAFHNRSRTVKKALRAVAQSLRLRTGEAPAVVARHTARVLQLTRQTVRQARRVFVNSRRVLRHADGRTRTVIQYGRVRLQRILQVTA